MSEERNIEQQLRAAAQQRRKEADGKFALHPATRRLLQGEVLRVRGQRSGPPHRSFWPRLAWGVALLAVLVVGTWSFIGSHKKPIQSVAQNKPVYRRGENAGFVQNAPSPPMATMAPAKVADSLAEVGADSSVAVAKAEVVLTPVSSPAPMTMAPPAAVGGGVVMNGAKPVLAADKKTRMKEEEAETVRVPPKEPLADRPEVRAFDRIMSPPVAASAVSGAVFAMAVTAPAQQQIFNFSNAAVNDGAGNLALAKRDLKNAPAKNAVAEAQLLASFQLEQTGDRVRIVDNDGSVYEGELLADARDKDAPDSAKLNSARLLSPPGAVGTDGMVVGGVNLGVMQSRTQNNDGRLAQNFRFAAAGTNLSLRQRVTINGQFLAVAEVTNAVNTLNYGGAQKIPNQQLKAGVQSGLLLSNGRVVGRAVTADGQQVELNAAQVMLK